MTPTLRPLAARLALAGAAATLCLALASPPALAWQSGVRNNSSTSSFSSWRGTSLGLVTGWIDWKNGWSGMQSYASGSQPRTIRSKSSNVSFGHGLFPQGGSLSACAAGDYNDEQGNIASRLAANGAGDAEIRLGWEASGDWFPWSAAGKPASQWKACFTNVAKAMKSAAPNLRIGWYMAKKGRIDVRTIWPDDAPITYVGVSHYDDAQARFGHETFNGRAVGPARLPAVRAQQGQEARDRRVGRGPVRRQPAVHPGHARLLQGGRGRPGARGLLQFRLEAALPGEVAAEVERALPRAVLASPPSPPSPPLRSAPLRSGAA